MAAPSRHGAGFGQRRRSTRSRRWARGAWKRPSRLERVVGWALFAAITIASLAAILLDAALG